MDALNEALQKVFNGQCCGWNNVLDILIVAVFIYYVLVLIRGTRAVQLLLGVLVLVAIYGLAVLLKLELTKFVLSAVFAFAVFALLIEETPERAAHRYGMRHRAALSVSAQTDAVVVVVSEETQAISIASNGRMIGGLDEERLRRVLSSLLRSRIQPLPFRSKAS